MGRQTPTGSFVLPYTETLGAQAVELYNRSGRTALEWQEIQIYDIMAQTGEGLWTHMKYGYSVPRRNGKSEILIMRAMWGLTHGERVLYTAHRTTTSHSAWEKIIERLAKAGFTEDEDYKTTKQFGLERIEWLKGGGVANFRTRSSKGGLGEGYDLLIIDEAQEYTADQESALKYVVSDSQNPQTLMCGTPPTAVSSGTVFANFRQTVLSGCGVDSGWAEWSIPEMSDAADVELWYETNPSLGAILTERKIRSELSGDAIDANIQRLGLWLRYNQKSAISEQEWDALLLEGAPKLDRSPQIFIGVKYAKGTGSVSMSVSVKTDDGKIFVESVDCRSARDGSAWLIGYMQNPHVKAVVIDGASGQSLLAKDMKEAGVKVRPILPKVGEVIESFALFEQSVFDGTICHADQPALRQIVSNCEHRAIGSSGGFGYNSILAGADVSLLESAVLAHWACAKAKKKKPQKITY